MKWIQWKNQKTPWASCANVGFDIVPSNGEPVRFRVHSKIGWNSDDFDSIEEAKSHAIKLAIKTLSAALLRLKREVAK